MSSGISGASTRNEEIAEKKTQDARHRPTTRSLLPDAVEVRRRPEEEFLPRDRDRGERVVVVERILRENLELGADGDDGRPPLLVRRVDLSVDRKSTRLHS